jgi:hypothetical protein
MAYPECYLHIGTMSFEYWLTFREKQLFYGSGLAEQELYRTGSRLGG